MGSQPGGGTETPVSDWIAVFSIVIGAAFIACSIIFDSLILGIVGSVLCVGGAVAAWSMGIMQHTEDYEPTASEG
jgi:hypothetical protein